MPFKSLLKRLLEDIPGALGAIIVDWEGESVDHVTRVDDYDIKVLGAHGGIILSQLKDTLSRIDSGELEQVVIRAGEKKILISPLTEEYLLILELGQAAIAARAAYKMHLCVDALRDEFVFD
ncbi:Predicted regulator of Ras-like GTPase activity, Roadblock/LC7/MglB family [Desulfuromusa kysingii]|uniref:Predicted regulator of Ras-like GTPase activity, Roadblock/LC7/MglB family n=1 Tax=Desulfuromusa kysingii TaxID=37625 RepID=A0A1H3WQT1_9BACT|nr:roadblock/LC7 domain-containing protein [Desulfuromusa kysingii]SDZ89537.1 Predicted regulator of Ras-like GTPase activity, Roadblock/LC7/MglB family [Desulfuromusa kysingii]